MAEKILLVDDNPVNLKVLGDALEPHGYSILAAPSGEVALRVAAAGAPELILLDILMPGLDGIETCRLLKEKPATRDIPVIFISAKNDSVAEGFRAGGIDYITKPFQSEEVLLRVENHLKRIRLTKELVDKNERLRKEIELRERADEKLNALSDQEAERWGVAGLVGKSRTVAAILEDVRKLHAFGATSVLLTGESGTGKELIARAIHFGGPRAKAPFIPVNCVAIPEELAESLFFGHLKGSFTGATADRKGYFEQADGGTLFLDEIGDMPLLLQAKLLRVLEDGIVTPLGATAGKRVNVRVLAATNVDLDAKIADRSFRQDLYFRLARFTVLNPPLRQRREDIPLLSEHFLHLFSREMGRRARLSPGALAMLEAYDFPGNVRELKNIIERSLIESGGGEIQASHIRLAGPRAAAAPSPRPAADFAAAEELPLNLDKAEDLLIQRALAAADGNIAEAARLLGVHRTRIYRNLAARRQT